MDASEQLIAWLRDAHAMEASFEQVLTRQIAAAGDQAEFRRGLEHHLEQTRAHGAVVERCLEMIGSGPSPLKSVAGTFLGAMEGLATGVFQDELVKHALADYAMEHFEIGCYSSIIAAAEEAGQEKIARLCGEILREEVAMAGWLEDQIPLLTRMHLQPSAA